jgi:cyclin-dependent kinase 7
LADFGLARHCASPHRPMTSQVVTRWYRAPELLFGSHYYSGGVDIWAAGCIFAELMLRTPYLPGESDMEQLGLIFKALGTPTEDTWPDMSFLPDYVTFTVMPKTPLKHLFTAAGPDALDLLENMLAINPLKRITATEALRHVYFQNEPHPTLPPQLPYPKTTTLRQKR